jgi:hypothetical protein
VAIADWAACAFAPIADPTGLQGTLRDYQRRGVAWLRYLEQLGLNPCLADEPPEQCGHPGRISMLKGDGFSLCSTSYMTIQVGA